MSALRLTHPERAALALALGIVVLHALAAGDALEYQRAALATQPWRLLTGHLVHVSWPHALVNAAALLIVARLFAPDLGVRAQLAVLALAALAISAALALLYPAIGWYRGLSGALHGLYFAGATKWLLTEQPRTLRQLSLPAVLVSAGWVKLALERPDGAPPPIADWLGAAVVPQAHLAGAVCGTLFGALLATVKLRRQRQRGE
jgi:rhomboid family GlyGly-CTERM serine protease